MSDTKLTRTDKIEYVDHRMCGDEWGHIEYLFNKVNEIIDVVNSMRDRESGVSND